MRPIEVARFEILSSPFSLVRASLSECATFEGTANLFLLWVRASAGYDVPVLMICSNRPDSGMRAFLAIKFVRGFFVGIFVRDGRARDFER